MKKNDFIVASINNPDFSVADFKDISEMNLGNTLMLSEDEYLKSKFIRENPLFLDSNGNFVKQKFSDFYRLKLRDFSEFSTESSLDNYQYGLFDTFRKAKDNIRPFGVSFEKVANSERRSTGIVGPNLLGERTFSDRELAQRERVFDYKEGKFRDYTPNDLAFTNNPLSWIGSLFDDPLVLATYDENGTHFDPILGREVEHIKGQKKLNVNGVPYYETLAGRSAASKDILSITDNLTIDGSWINKYDFFDSDGMDKSVAGTVMKNLAILAPIFIPGAGQYYAGALVVREMAKTMPMLYGMAGLFDNDLQDSKLLNTIAAVGNKFTGSTSDYAKEKMFSFENFASLVSDVALQWSQQQWVINNLSKINKATKATEEAAKAKALKEYTTRAQQLMTQGERGDIAMTRVAQLTGAKDRTALNELIKGDNWMASTYGGAALEKYLTPAREIIARKTKLAQDLSLGYMAIISNTDVYQDALDHGASKREAAMLALGSTVGMFSVDKYLGLGEIFYDPAQRAERATFRSAVLNESLKITDQLKNIIPITTKAGNKAVTDERKGLGRYFLKGIQAGKKAVENYQGAIKEGTLGFFGKALGEGLEEVSEEAVTDIVKQLGEIAGQYGLSEVTDLGAWNNMLDRYLMSFLGGAIGGGIFSLKDGNFKARQASGELLTLLRQGKGKEIRDELKRLHDKGQLGSTELSYKTEQTYDDKNNPQGVFLTADENNQSLNDYAYNVLTQSIEQIESILQKNHLVKSEDELFENLVLLDENYTALRDYLQDASYITGYQRRYQQLVKNIVAQELKINSLSKTDGSSNTNKVELEEARRDLTNMLLERDKFFNGDYSLEYLQKMLFAINPQLAGAFMPLTKKLFTRAMLNVDYDLLDGGMKEFVDKMYELQVKDPSKIEEELDKSFDMFQKLQPLMEPILSKLTGGSKQWENIRKTLDEKGILRNEDMYTIDSVLPGETEESDSYINRKNPMEGESEVDFAKRLKERLITAAEHNARLKILKLQTILDEALTWDYDPTTGTSKPATFIDLSTRRYLMAYLGETQNHIKDRLIARRIGTAINKELLKNAENYDELVNKVRDFYKKKFEKLVDNEFMEYLGNTEYGGLTSFYSQISPNRKFTLEEVLKGLNREGWEDYSVPEQLAEMFEDSTGMIADFDLIQDALKYDELYTQYMTEADPDKLTELKKQLDELGLKEYSAWDEEEFNKRVNENAEQALSTVESLLQDLNRDFLTDPDLKAAKDLEERLSVEENPAVELVREIAPKIGGSAVEVEKALESILQLFREKEKPTDFILSGDQVRYLEEAKKIIAITTAMVAASSRESNLIDGMTYNKAVNKFHADHLGRLTDSEFFKNFEPLFEMDEKIGGLLIAALNGYQQEINQWIQLSRENQANSVRSLLNAADALNRARLKFLSGSMTSSDFLNESLVDPSDPNASYLFEKQFYDNVQKAISEGRDIKDIFKELLAHINLDEEILSGNTSNIDETLQELSAYDKFMYLVSLVALDPTELVRKELQFIKDNPNIAPLATQLPGMLLGQALASKPEIINKALEALQELAKAHGLNMPVMWNTTIVTGLGGGGKTSVEAKYLINDAEETWIAGPTENQLRGLGEVAPKAKGFTIEKLLKAIYTGELKTTKGKGLDGWSPRILVDDESKYIIKDAPKHLLIDEATHIDTTKLQIISNWAKKAGVRVTLLGDENQRGAEYNLNREALLAYRTPRLNFSLRNESIWKVLNLNQLVSMLDRMRNSSKATTDAVLPLIHESLKNRIPLSYFENENILEGDKVVSRINAEDLHRLSGSVAYIGDNKDLINFILSNLNPGTTFTALDKNQVQGAEFDYVIVDSDWNKAFTKNADKKFLYEEGIEQTTDFLRDLYTMISRSRKGSIVLDNQLTNVVNPIKEEYTTKYERLSEDTIKDFIDARTAYLLGILDSIKKEEEPEEIVVEEPTEELTEEGPKNIPDTEKEKLETVEKTEEEKKVTGYRAYGNVAFLGDVKTGPKNEWIANGLRDIGIFGPAGEVIATTGSEKRQLVRDLNFVKSLFLYNLNIDLYELPSSLRRRLPKDALKNAEFYLVAEDKSDVHKLTGLTTLKLDELDFIKGKVISILARVDTPLGKATITLGAVANPATWRKLLDNPELSTEEKTSLEAQIKHYEELLKNLVNSESLEIKINKPKFNGRTELIKLRVGDVNEKATNPKDVRKIRLESLYDDVLDEYNSDTDTEELLKKIVSEFDARTGNSVVSPVHIITAPIPGIDPSLVGHAVLFVSNNNTLAPELLGKGFIEQLQNRAEGKETQAQVRMIVLDNAGVSFHSLYRGGFKDIYSTSTGDKEFAFPNNLFALGIRMLSGLWNFRADLTRFINAMNNSGYTRAQLIDMAKTDSEMYKTLLTERRKPEDKYDPVISSTEYKRWLESHSDKEKASKVLKLIEFNESLDIPRFRVGWSDRTGAQIRRIQGLKEGNPYYKNVKNWKPEETNGIFINPDLADLYAGMLEYLFTNVVDRIYDTTTLNKEEHINYKETEKWVNAAKNKKLIINDEGGTLPIPNQDKVKAFTLILTKIASYMHRKMHFGQEEFENRRNREGDKALYHIYLDYENKKDEITYAGLDQFLKANIGGSEVTGLILESATRRDVIGQTAFTYKDGEVVFQDCRIDNFFNLIFHGVAFEKNYNEFDGSQQAETLAPFKYGMFVDPVLLKTGGTARDMIAACATNRKLFKTDVIPGNPILEFSFDEVTEETTEEESGEETEQLPILEELKNFGLDPSRWNFDGFSDEDIIAFIEKKLDDINKKMFEKGEGDLAKLVFKVDASKIYTLNDMYPEIGTITATEPSGDGTAFTITNDKGKKFDIRYNEGEIMVKERTVLGARAGKEELITSFEGQEINKKIQDFIEGKDLYSDSDALTEWMDSNDGLIYSKEDLKSIKKKLRNFLEDEGVLEDDDIKLLENIIDEFINQIKTSDC